MTEILTESFCERCGTRYTFESERPRTRLKGVKVMSRGLKNFVMSDGTSMDEAMAAARSETDRESTAYQLDAFHKTFNFCMSCRQYTCPTCWNEDEAQCLTCSPHLGQEIMPAPFPHLHVGAVEVVDPAIAAGTNGSNGTPHDPDEIDVVGRLAALTAVPVADPVAEPDAPALEMIGAEEIAALSDTTATDTGPGFWPGQDLDAEVEAYEREREAAEAVSAVEPEPGPETVLAVEPEAVSAVEPEPGPVDVVAQPVWQIVAPDPATQVDVPTPTDAPPSIPAATSNATAEPEWPTRAAWLGSSPSKGLPFLGRPSAPRGGIDALWAASAQEVVTPAAQSKAAGGIQPCVSCGLSLSATARFCRRCGTPQAG